MTTSFKSVSWWLTIVTGLLLVFIGIRFFVWPETAEAAFGIQVATGGDHAFHYIKGARDLFSGVAIVLLLLLNERKALGILLLSATVIPSVDLWVVVSHPHYATAHIYPHLTAIILCIVLGVVFLRKRPPLV